MTEANLTKKNDKENLEIDGTNIKIKDLSKSFEQGNPNLIKLIEKHKDKPCFIELVIKTQNSINKKIIEFKQFPKFCETIKIVLNELINETLDNLNINDSEYKTYIQKLYTLQFIDGLLIELLFFDSECVGPEIIDKEIIKKTIDYYVSNIFGGESTKRPGENKIYKEFEKQ